MTRASHRQTPVLTRRTQYFFPGMCLALLLSWTSGAWAQVQFHWANSDEGDWTVVENWVNDAVPVDGDRVKVDNGGTARIQTSVARLSRLEIGETNGNSGHLEILGSGELIMQSGYVHVGDADGSEGTLSVSGENARLTLGVGLVIGESGQGTLDIGGGAQVTDGFGSLGLSSTGSGDATVTGAGSAWVTGTNSNMSVGERGTGELLISAGGRVESGSTAFIGRYTGSTGEATVTGSGSEFVVPENDLHIGYFLGANAGTGTLTIADQGRVEADSIVLGDEGGSATLNIGSGAAAGVLDTPTVNGGGGAALSVLNFNHTDADYFFSRNGTAGGDSINITGITSVNHSGSGTTTLTGTNTYTGATTVAAGTLRVNGSLGNTAVTVQDTATLDGSGSITGAVSVEDGGTLAPGNSPGQLATGNLSLATGATLTAELNGTAAGTEYDQLVVTGTVDVSGATLDLSLGFVPAADTRFELISNDGVDQITGVFDGLAEGGTFNDGTNVFQISYVGGDGNDVVVTYLGALSNTLTYSAGANGSLTGSTTQSVNFGDDGAAVTAVPDSGYSFDEWSDGSSDNPRTDIDVRKDISVTAAFVINQFSLEYSADVGGSITGSTAQTIDFGDDGSEVTAVANGGYFFTQWSDGSTDNPRTDSDIVQDLSVTAQFAAIPRPEITGDLINTGTLIDLIVANGAVITGGFLGGVIDNAGEVRNVSLLPFAIIRGGVLSGSISGNAGSPGRVVNVFIAADAFLEHIRLGANTQIHPLADFGQGVCFESQADVPDGFALERLLSPVGEGGAVQLDRSVLCSTTVPSLLEDVGELSLFADLDSALEQNAGDGTLRVILAEGPVTIRPFAVSLAEPGSSPGVTINADGNVQIVTDRGQLVLAYPVLQDIELATQAFADLQLQMSVDARGNLVLSPDADSESSTYYIVRPYLIAVPAPVGSEAGVFVAAGNFFQMQPGVTLVFSDASGSLLQQPLMPVPADWPVLQEMLLGVDGAESVSINADGTISLALNGEGLRARPDYRVEAGPAPDSGQVSYADAGDLNDDGINDIVVTYANGDRQILYLMM